MNALTTLPSLWRITLDGMVRHETRHTRYKYMAQNSCRNADAEHCDIENSTETQLTGFLQQTSQTAMTLGKQDASWG